jgi:hypothetical protein
VDIRQILDRRTDLSTFVVHFTCHTSNPLADARVNLASILRAGRTLGAVRCRGCRRSELSGEAGGVGGESPSPSAVAQSPR